MSALARFLIVLIPATLGGALWFAMGLPLGWLMGAAIVCGLISYTGHNIELSARLYRPSLTVVGAGVGLTITPAVASQVGTWLPLMVALGFVGVVLAVIVTPFLARYGQINSATAFFSLMPGGIIEMADVGSRHGADPTAIATLHAVRVALVVGILPLSLYIAFPASNLEQSTSVVLTWPGLLVVLGAALLGGYMGARCNMPAGWLLGALLAVALLAGLGLVDGRIPDLLMAAAQVIVGISLGSRFRRDRLHHLPRALGVGALALFIIIFCMGLLGVLISNVLPMGAPTMVLAMSIGGLAEMVLTARALDLDMAMVAAFQASRAVLVNSCAGLIWARLANFFNERS